MLFASVCDELLDYVAGAEILIHNAAFDIGFLDAELTRLKRDRFEAVVAQVSDTLQMAREMFPGKSNSLDALCKRLEVDNTSRSLHGALLDAGLLAEVYIRMTRGQDTLVIDAVEESGGEITIAAVDLAALDLFVLDPDDVELAAHQVVLAELDKASGGRAAWKPAPAMA